MKDFEFTKEEVLGLNRSMQVASQVSIPVSAALKIAAINRKTEEGRKDYEAAEQSLVKEFAKRDEDDNIVYEKDDNGRDTQQPVIENLNAYVDKRNELLDETIELRLPTFKQKDFDSIKKVVGGDDDKDGSQKELPPIVLKAWVMLLDDSLDIESIID